MRPGQNKRLRGRNNRKGPNPLTRSYESNGPDVKVRGTAQHIAEKYLQLARDAQSSGDPVMAESYLQHAEHYYRLIAAAQAAQQAQIGQQMGQPRPPAEVDFDDEEEDVINDRFASVAERLPQPQYQQPQFQAGQPGFQDRQNFNGERQPQQDRQPRQERPFNDRGQQGQGFNRDGRRFRDQRQADSAPEGRSQDEDRAPQGEAAAGLPAFITAPSRPLPADAPQPDLTAMEDGAEQQEAGGYHLRPRRRRRSRPTGLVGAETGSGDMASEPASESDAS